MKLKVVLGCLLVFLLLGTGTAQAFRWHLGYGQAMRETQRYGEEWCDEERECISSEVLTCERQTHSRVDCAPILYFPAQSACIQELHWGVSRGYVVLKGYGRISCFSLR